MKARPYQVDAIADIRGLLSAGCKRILLQLATGGGKTFVFSTILKGAYEKGSPCVMAVRSRHLVDQASERLKAMGVPHGVLMANHKGFDLSQAIQVVSVDTCHARQLFPPAKVVIVDEAHTATSPTFKAFLSNYEGAIWISVTATPWIKEGLGHLAEKVVYPISLRDLTDQGYLAPAKYFVPTKFDAGNIRVVNGEYKDEDALLEFEKQAVYGDVIANYKKMCTGECTWVFAINIKHAIRLQMSFIEAGIHSVVITGDTPLDLRKSLLETEDLVISIATLTTGVDVPRLKNIILCRPTQSKNLHVQILGRATRPYAGKDHFKVLDMVGNVSRHGFIVDEVKTDLKPRPKRASKEAGVPIKVCPECYAANPCLAKVCVNCENPFPVAARQEIKAVAAELMEVKDSFMLRGEAIILEIWGKGHKFGSLWFRLGGKDGARCFARMDDYRKIKQRLQDWESGAKRAPFPRGSRRD
ncbi:SSL2 DNA or RNA helicases of superfamily II [uncultured Caudovirales phage]|uniref:SSL2 DNA or RNA helicases of superfamily II n=1 Tax=uncultured Caudovirales phage TaxID=2100421 RepID=A0A6J5PQM8_9CAUD|nr:SSL2 DNA or RNA helicases of superfamily II [uncultured Caudovirales phage]